MRAGNSVGNAMVREPPGNDTPSSLERSWACLERLSCKKCTEIFFVFEWATSSTAWHILGRGWTFDLGFSPMVLMLPTQEAAPVARDQSSCGRRLRECSPDGSNDDCRKSLRFCTPFIVYSARPQ